MRDIIDTTPAELNDLPMAEIEDLQIVDPRAICNLLQSVMLRGTPFVIHESGGTSHSAQMWAVDAKKKIISFAEDAFSPGLPRVTEAKSAVALCYVDNIKIQFQLFDRTLIQGPRSTVMQAALPLEILQFRRRASYRVKPDRLPAPSVSLTHPNIATGPIDLDILDLSEQGCGLLMSPELPPVRRGYVFNKAILKLDQDVSFNIDLTVRRQALVASRVPKILLGCEIQSLAGAAKVHLQNYLSRFYRGRALSDQ